MRMMQWGDRHPVRCGKGGSSGKGGKGGKGGGGGGTQQSQKSGAASVDGGTTRTAEGDIQPNGRLGAVSNQEQFNTQITELARSLSNEFDLNGNIPIFMLRRASPNLSREEFDRYLGGMSAADQVRLSSGGQPAAYQSIGGRIPPATNVRNFRDPQNQSIQNARVRDSYTTRVGASRDAALFDF